MIYEPWESGHRYHYVREIIIALSELSKNINIIFVTSYSASQSNEFSIHLEDISHLFTIDNSYGQNTPERKISLWETSKHLINSCKSHSPKHVFIPTANGILQYIGLKRFFGLGGHLKTTEFEAMLMSGGIFQGWSDKILGLLWRYFTKHSECSVIHVLYPLQKDTYDTKKIEIANVISLTPEPVEKPVAYTTKAAREKLGIPIEGRYIVEAGVIDIRKGADYLLDAFSKIETDQDIRLLLAGKVSEEIKELIDNQYKALIDNKKLIVLDHYLSDDQFTSAFLTATIFCLPYRHLERSSGIAVRAAAFHCPMLTSNTGWLGKVIPKYQLGSTCDVTNQVEFSNMILQSLDLADRYELTQAGKFFTNYHTLQNFRAHWMKRIRQKLDLPEDKNYIAWDKEAGNK